MSPMRAALVLALVLGMVCGPAEGADSEIEKGREAYALSRDLMSPYCPGRTLADCPSPDAAALREEIRTRIGEGVPAEQVRADLERRFGSRVQGVPRGALGWSVPGLVLLAGAVLLVIAIRRLSRPAVEDEPAIPTDLEREIERELRDQGL